MTTRTTIQSWRALLVAGVILMGTGYVIFGDVIDGAHITSGHVLTALALLIATAAGHQIAPTFHAQRYALTVSMFVLAVGAVVYIGLLSGSRNSEQVAVKAERIEAANAQRAAILAERKTAQEMLDKARADVARECASGEGTRCRGRRATESVYRAAVAGHDAKLEALGPPQTANAGYKAAAEGLALLPWFRATNVAEIEHGLVVLLPWLAVLLSELSVPAFLSLALGHETIATVAAPATVVEPPPGGPGKRRQLPTTNTRQQLPANVVRLADKRPDIVAALDAAGKSLTVSELALAMGVTKGEASRRWREAGDLVTAQRQGRFVRVQLARRAVA